MFHAIFNKSFTLDESILNYAWGLLNITYIVFIPVIIGCL